MQIFAASLLSATNCGNALCSTFGFFFLCIPLAASLIRKNVNLMLRWFAGLSLQLSFLGSQMSVFDSVSTLCVCVCHFCLFVCFHLTELTPKKYATFSHSHTHTHTLTHTTHHTLSRTHILLGSAICPCHILLVANKFRQWPKKKSTKKMFMKVNELQKYPAI